MDEDLDDEESSFMGGDDDDDEDEYYGDDHEDGALGFNLRAMAGFFSNHHGRFKALLENIRPQCPPAEQLTALEELANLLSISQEETLMGQFNTDGFVREFIRILGGTPPPFDAHAGWPRAAPAPSSEPPADDPTRYERQILACRCLANLIEAMPYSARSVVENNGVPAIVAKLVDMQVVDLAEQCLETLEKISIDNPNAIVREGGLMAILSYLDFFNIHVQRTAMTTVSNCCRKLQEGNVSLVRDTIPLIAKVVLHSDRKLQEAACKSVVRIIESYRHYPTMLEQLVTRELCSAVKNVLAPPATGTMGGDQTLTTNVPVSMVTELVHAFSLAANAAPAVANRLIASDFSQALYAILTGCRAPSDGTGAQASDNAGLDKMTLLHNLGSRPKEQLQEALSLTIELLPLPPKYGVFDPRNYTEQAIARAKQDQASPGRGAGRKAPHDRETRAIEKSAASKGLSAKDKLPPEAYAMGLQLCKLMLPALVEIHTALAIASIRLKVIAAILKVLAFASAEELETLLSPVSMSTFWAGVLSPEDGPLLVQGSLQIVELLLVKLGPGYRRLLEREGVMWEIEKLASQDTTGLLPPDEDGKELVLNSTSHAELPAPLSMPLPMRDGRCPANLIQWKPGFNILRARMIVLLYAKPEPEKNQETVLDRAIAWARHLRTRALVSIEQAQMDLDRVFAALQADAEGLAGWELLKSGLIEALLVFVGASSEPTGEVEGDLIPAPERRDLFTQALASHPQAAERLVQRLQETVSRVQSLEPASLGPAVDDLTRRWPGLGLTKQMRMKVVADEPSLVPANHHQLVIGIHAVASFAALEDFLRARLAPYPVQYSPAPARSSSGDRLSSILAAAMGAPSGSGSGSNSSPRRGEWNPGFSFGSVPTRDPYLDMNVPLGQGTSSGRTSEANQADQTGEIHLPRPSGDGNEDGSEAGSSSRTSLPSPTAPSRKEDARPNANANANPNPNPSPSPSPSQAVSVPPAYDPGQDHFVFTVGGREVSLDETVFSAVYRMHKDRTPTWTPDRSFWSLSYPVSYRRVRGPRPKEEVPAKQDGDHVFPPDSIMYKVLKLLQVLYGAFTDTRAAPMGKADDAFTSLFINNKLTAQLNRQLEEPLITASHVLPEWAERLPRAFPFLFPFATRYAFLQSVATGTTRIIARWQTQLRANGDTSTMHRARDESFGSLGRVPRQKVRIEREHLMESIVRICNEFVSRNSMLEIEYFGEVGTGLGPTLEFYSLASREFAAKEHHLWLGSCSMDAAASKPSNQSRAKGKAKGEAQKDGEKDRDEGARYVEAPQGLFPLPLKAPRPKSLAERKRVSMFATLGTFVAKALLDSRIVHIEFSPVFWALVIGAPVPRTLQTLSRIDLGLASSLHKLYAMSEEEVASLGLDFTLPGDEAHELVKGGKKRAVTRANLDEYVESILDTYVGQGMTSIIEAFREGFAKMMDWRDLALFTPDELVGVFGNAPEDWSKSTLSAHIKPDHGFNPESEAYLNLLSMMASFDQRERRVFLQWLTGSPKLPIGGFRALQPPLTVVRRPHEAPLTPDDYLPSVMTCVNYLKLPNYSTADILQMRMRKAMHEGGASFHLS